MIDRILSDIASLVVIAGAGPIFFWLKNHSFEKKRKEIRENLVMRDDIRDKLRNHADGYDRSTPRDMGIRLVYWKNYPWNLDDDGYKQILYYNTNLNKKLSHDTEFLNNIGILVEEHIWYVNKSLYLGKFGTYIIDRSGQNIAGFLEIKQKVKLVKTLRYKYIINWDFEEKIGYEPIFYTKYTYTNQKLYDEDFLVQNYDDDGIKKNLIFYKQLNTRNYVKSNTSIWYRYLVAKGQHSEKNRIRNNSIQTKKGDKRKDS